MAGKIIADTLEHSTAGSVTTDYVVNGSAKQWCHFDGTAGTLSLDDSLNTSSLTDSATGIYLANFTNNMSNATYFGDGDSDANRVINTELATSNLKIRLRNTSDSAADSTATRGASMGDLA